MDKFALKSAAFAARLIPLSMKRAIYHIPPLARLIRNRLNQAAPAGLVQVPIAAGYLTGKSMILDLQSEKDYWLGTYEPELQATIRECRIFVALDHQPNSDKCQSPKRKIP